MQYTFVCARSAYVAVKPSHKRSRDDFIQDTLSSRAALGLGPIARVRRASKGILYINATRGGSCGCVGVEIHPRNLLISEKEKNFFILISDPAIILLK